jgi:hypothetical protein
MPSITYPKPKFRLVIIVIAIVFILGYGFFRGKDLLLGPVIIVSSPTNGASVTDSYLEVKGKAKRISRLFMNGKKITTDEQGNFTEILLLAPGYNIISLQAEDSFNRKTTKKLELLLK